MTVETVANLIIAWCTALTLIGGTVSFVFRHWLKAYIEKYNVALKATQDKLVTAEADIKQLKSRYITVRGYARRLYDTMVAQGMKPDTPPDELYD